MQIKHIPLDAISVSNRYRKDLGNLRPLMESMLEIGLLQPIGVAADPAGDRQYRLVYGERRLRAAQALCWTEISAVIVEVDSLRAEHDENEMRKAFTVSERVAIGLEIERRLGNRQGQRSDKEQLMSTSAQVAPGSTEAIAAKRAGSRVQIRYR